MPLTKLGPNTLTLTAVNAYAGPTAIDGGVLSISADRNLGIDPTIATPDQLVINGGGTLQASASMMLRPRGASGWERGR